MLKKSSVELCAPSVPSPAKAGQVVLVLNLLLHRGPQRIHRVTQRKTKYKHRLFQQPPTYDSFAILHL